MGRPVRYRYRADLLNITRADLYKVRLDLGFHTYKVLEVKLAGVVCPDAKEAPDSIKFVESYIAGKHIEVQTFRQVKGVWLGTLWVNGASFNSELLKSPHGREFRQ